jgi:hypothetical protein
MARKMVYLVTFAALLGPGAQGGEGATLRDLESLSRAHIRDAVLDAVAHPERAMAVGRPRAGGLQVVKMAVFEEIHAHGGKRFHVALAFVEHTLAGPQACFVEAQPFSQSLVLIAYYVLVRCEVRCVCDRQETQCGRLPPHVDSRRHTHELVRGGPGALQCSRAQISA